MLFLNPSLQNLAACCAWEVAGVLWLSNIGLQDLFLLTCSLSLS